MHELEISLSRFSKTFWGSFETTMNNILHKQVPLKKRYVLEIIIIIIIIICPVFFLQNAKYYMPLERF